MHRQILLQILAGNLAGPAMTMLAAAVDASGDVEVANGIRHQLVQLQGIHKVTLSSTFPDHPLSFGQCEQLLAKIPEIARYREAIAAISPEWQRLVAAWADVRRMYELDQNGREVHELLTRIAYAPPAER